MIVSIEQHVEWITSCRHTATAVTGASTRQVTRGTRRSNSSIKLPISPVPHLQLVAFRCKCSGQDAHLLALRRISSYLEECEEVAGRVYDGFVLEK